MQAIKFMEMASRAPQLVLACLATCNVNNEYLAVKKQTRLEADLLLENRVCVKECKDEAAADDDARAVLEHGLYHDDQQEGDVSTRNGINRYPDTGWLTSRTRTPPPSARGWS